jgi:hypothetical protein
VLDIAEPAAALTIAAFDHLQAPPPQAPPAQ